jgi:transcription termination/antitermination protein NusA
MTRKLDAQTLATMTLFEKITHAHVKDCFDDSFGNMVFVVQEGHIRKALGKNVENIDKLKKVFNKKIRILEFSSNISTFIRNVVRPIKLEDVVCNGKIYTMVAQSHKDRGILIGRNASTLRNAESIVKSYFEIDELKVDVKQGSDVSSRAETSYQVSEN